jgi:AcrR family transcriptional regulator
VQTVEAILGAAAHLLYQRGYAATSTNAIALRAGVSIGSFYQYFRDKDDVFKELVGRHRREVVPVIQETLRRMAEPDSDVVAVTLDLLRRMAEVNADNPRLLAAIDHELAWMERDDDQMQVTHEVVTSVLRARLSSRAFSPEVIATLLITIIGPLSRWIVHSKPASLDTEQFIEAFGVMLRGLLRTSPSSRRRRRVGHPSTRNVSRPTDQRA